MLKTENAGKHGFIVSGYVVESDSDNNRIIIIITIITIT